MKKAMRRVQSIGPDLRVNAFFARGVADLRGLFDAIPLLMVLLVPALTMRLWAGEKSARTYELLMTLPISVRQLVLGKLIECVKEIGA